MGASRLRSLIISWGDYVFTGWTFRPNARFIGFGLVFDEQIR